MFRKTALTVAVSGMFAFGFGCAITDYDGIPNHKTVAEAKLWGKDVAFSGFANDLDGTYAYTVKYDNSLGNKVTINSYRNAVIGSFFRDGLVDVDGDDVQGSAGITGGKFLPQFVAVDRAPGAQFFANITQDKSNTGPLAALSIGGSSEEIDKDWELNRMDAFASLDELFKAIWAGSTGGSINLEVTEVSLDGFAYPIDNFSVNMRTNGLRPTQFSMDFSTVAGQQLLETILNNTTDGAPVDLQVKFDGGLSLGLPAGMTVAFNHGAF